MSGNRSPDYKALFFKAEAERKQAEEEKKQAEEEKKQAEEEKKQAEETARQLFHLNRPTTFTELIQHCHDLFWRPLRAQIPSRCTTGIIRAPIGKYCPLRLLPWTDCDDRQRRIYQFVCRYLQPTEGDARELFTSLVRLEGRQRITRRPISSEKDLEIYERVAVEDAVQDIIAELCRIPEACEEFLLGSGIWFENHANSLEDDEVTATQPSTTKPSRPDSFCIYQMDDDRRTLLTTVEYKPPHKLSAASLQLGLRPMDFWREVAQADSFPIEEPDKSRFKAEWLVGSVIVQEFHVMIQEGLEYSYVTNGLMDVQLWVPYDDPTTLYYHLGDPGIYEMAGVAAPGTPRTRVERTLCLCLMSSRTRLLRDQAWRNAALMRLPKWYAILDSDRPQNEEVETPRDPDVDDANGKPATPEQSGSEYIPTPSPVRSGRRMITETTASCAPPAGPHYHEENSSDSEADPTASAGRKRGFSQVTTSPSTRGSAPRADPQGNRRGQPPPHDALYCTQKCLLGLRQGGTLDATCPNTKLHTLGRRVDRHLIGAAELVRRLKKQLDLDLDHNCTPIGPCGASGAPFKITCATYGYTVVGKGTTSKHWGEVSREAEVYGVLQRAQGSAVPVFLGSINLALTYFLHGAGRIRHMLLMGWGGESVGHTILDGTTQRAISRSVKEIRRLGVVHLDLRPENILWNAELQRALIIDFHLCTLNRRPLDRRPSSAKRSQHGLEDHHSKRLRV
ncbi:Protein kinase-like domain protein [Metarhizium album ARSEF 1941]|uniref:Protein kinase-like domain protein n=1 Tax=Metarhizium album (strain ARSEF 1941) TaxID=1081103 RepID=A0A0B2WJ19_METAS|nr:Protein kinase-like domain protein [Metarhizium album ARSEF 1941]KHN93689.1 Protein kinase-like domain protein [Metarhizium album ARSEF 1941]